MTKKEDNTINLSDKKVKLLDRSNQRRDGRKKSEILKEKPKKKVDDDIDSKVSSFMKELKLDKLYKDHETNDKNLQDFLNQKDLKEQQLREKEKESAKVFIDLFNRQAKIHDWSNMYDHDHDIEDFDRHIKNVCRTEYFNELKKNTPEGKLLQEIDGKRKSYVKGIKSTKIKIQRG